MERVWKWRKALGVGRTDAEGSRRLIQRAVREASSVRVPPTSAARRRGAAWTPDEIALVGALPDEEVAERTGRTLEAIRWKRRGLAAAQQGGVT
jgi:hypothetical protein